MGGSLMFLGEHGKAVVEFKQAIATYMPGVSQADLLGNQFRCRRPVVGIACPVA